MYSYNYVSSKRLITAQNVQDYTVPCKVDV